MSRQQFSVQAKPHLECAALTSFLFFIHIHKSNIHQVAHLVVPIQLSTQRPESQAVRDRTNRVTDSPITTAPQVPPKLQELIDQDVMIMAIDVEAHCCNQSHREWIANGKVHTNRRRISDIGMATIDSRLIKVVATSDLGVGDRGFNISEYIIKHDFGVANAYHDASQIKKHPGWCKTGRADDFIFGEVTWIPKKEDIAQSLVKAIDKKAGILRTWSKKDYSTIQSITTRHHKILFVFHDKTNDLIWLEENGVDLPAIYPNCEIIDIQKQRAARSIAGQIGAGDFFYTLGLSTAALHNGGNDAMFELQAYLATLCLTEQQMTYLGQKIALRPMLPAIWEPGFNWSDARLKSVDESCETGAKQDERKDLGEDDRSIEDEGGIVAITRTLVVTRLNEAEETHVSTLSSSRPTRAGPGHALVGDVSARLQGQTSASFWAGLRR